MYTERRWLAIEQTLEFKCFPIKSVFLSEDFKIYACSIDALKYKDLHVNKYDNITIKGNMSNLIIGTEYIVKATEVRDSYGVGYNVINIRREKPKSESGNRKFLSEILTQNQVNSLLSAYPDIINMIINEEVDTIDFSMTKGIKEYTFNIIKEKIIENFKLADIIEEFNGLFNMTIIKKLYIKFTSVEKIREYLRRDPYQCLCKLGGVGFKTADSILLNIYKSELKKDINKRIFEFDLPSSYQRAKACVDYLLTLNENEGNTYMNVIKLKNVFDTYIPEAKHNLIDILKNDDIYFNRELMSVSRTETYETEKFIADVINEANKIKTIWDLDYKKFQSLEEFKLSDEQCKTSKYICENNLVLLVGYGGSGKSSSTKALINMLDYYNKSSLLLAPTGRASKVLSCFTNKKGMTIHRGLQYFPPNNWGYNKDNKINYDVIIVDEFSMVDIFLFKKLLDAIDFTKTKLLLIGDDAQLPSIGAGNVLFDLLQLNKIPTVTLDKIFRYGKGGLSTVATDVRNGHNYLDITKKSMQVFGEDKSYIFMPINQDKIVNYSVKLYQTLLEKGYKLEDIAVLSSYNVGDYGTSEINKKLQGVINSKYSSKINFGDKEFRVNDLVMNFSNDYKAVLWNNGDIDINNTAFIANGESGVLEMTDGETATVNYDGTLIYYEKGSLKNIGLAYAMSTHKSQGGQFKVVILLTPKAHTFMLNSNLLYVGISRAKEQCYHLGDISAVNNSLRKKANFDRNTLMKYLFKE